MFLFHTTDDGRIPGFEYLPAAAITPKVGMMLAANASGNLAAASGAVKPQYVSMADRDAAVKAGELIPVVRVQPDMIFEVPLSVAGTSLKVGQKVTIADDGLQVTATTTDGIAEIVEILGTAVGAKVRVRFA